MRFVQKLLGLVVAAQSSLGAAPEAEDRRGLLFGASVAPGGYDSVVQVLASESNNKNNLVHFCTGILVDPQWVVTSSSCSTGEHYHVRFSGSRLNIDVSVENYFMYPAAPELMFIKLGGSMNSISPISINYFDQDLEKMDLTTKVVGWGREGDVKTLFMGSRREQELSISNCKDEFDDETSGQRTKFICAGFGWDEDNWGCFGDIGAPLLDETGKILLGISVYRKYCAEDAYHAAFVNIREAWNKLVQERTNNPLFATRSPVSSPATSSPTLSPSRTPTRTPTLSPVSGGQPVTNSPTGDSVTTGAPTPSGNPGGGGVSLSPVPSPPDLDQQAGGDESGMGTGPIIGIAAGVTGAIALFGGMLLVARHRQNTIASNSSNSSDLDPMHLSQHDSDGSGVGPPPFGAASKMSQGSSPFPVAQPLAPSPLGSAQDLGTNSAKGVRSVRQLPFLFNKRISQIV